jgi:hypothetical protein
VEVLAGVKCYEEHDAQAHSAKKATKKRHAEEVRNDMNDPEFMRMYAEFKATKTKVTTVFGTRVRTLHITFVPFCLHHRPRQRTFPVRDHLGARNKQVRCYHCDRDYFL